jgi:flagellar biosynthesis/type III secretory pathway protein FliH
VIRPVRTLVGEVDADLADRFTAVLRTLADEARTSVERAAGPGSAGPP